MDNPILLAALTILLVTALAFLVLRPKKHPNPSSQPTPQEPEQPPIEVEEKKVEAPQVVRIKKTEELESEYNGLYFGAVRVKAANSMHSVTAMRFKESKILVATTKNQMTMYDLKTWKRDQKSAGPEKYFVSLDNNGASALDIGKRFYYAALTFDKTIVVYEFKGGQNKVYFKEHTKFPRNILKSNATCLQASASEQYIVTAGSDADTVVDVWSMKGERLATMNTYQIEHYEISCGKLDVMVRGWTSEVKILGLVEEKDGSFKKLEKKVPLTNEESPLHSAIDNQDMFAASVSKHHKVRLWWLFDSYHKDITSDEINKRGFTHCSLFTFESGYGRYKPVVILSNDKGFVVTDQNLNIVREVEGVQVKEVLLTGTSKKVVMGTVNGKGQMLLWNLEKELELIKDITM